MKMISHYLTARVTGLTALALLGFTALGGSAQAQSFASPVGPTWDCVLSGKGQNGIAFLQFQDDYTFSGYQILAGAAIAQQESEGRNPAGGIGRDNDLPGGGSSQTNVFVYGFGPISGHWAYDAQGRVIGNFMLVASGGGSTNAFTTNSVSFSAKVVANSRLTLVSHSRHGKMDYRGVPYATTLPSIAGNWYGNWKKNKVWSTDFYTLTRISNENPWADEYPDLSEFPGIYFTLDGIGGAYDFAGFCLLSSQKKIAYAFESYHPGGTNGVLSATFGNFSTKSGLKSSTKGLDPASGKITYSAMQTSMPGLAQ